MGQWEIQLAECFDDRILQDDLASLSLLALPKSAVEKSGGESIPPVGLSRKTPSASVEGEMSTSGVDR